MRIIAWTLLHLRTDRARKDGIEWTRRKKAHRPCPVLITLSRYNHTGFHSVASLESDFAPVTAAAGKVFLCLGQRPHRGPWSLCHADCHLVLCPWLRLLFREPDLGAGATWFSPRMQDFSQRLPPPSLSCRACGPTSSPTRLCSPSTTPTP